MVGPEVLSGPAAAAVWAEVLGRDIHYAGDDVQAFEAQLLQQGLPGWMAYDLRLMMSGIQQLGQLAAPGAAGQLVQRLGRPLRSYRAFVTERTAERVAERTAAR